MNCSSIATYDFSIYKGDDVKKQFRYLADELPVDLTGYVIELECTVSGISQTANITDAAAGEYEFVFDKATTAAIVESRAKYEVVFWPTGLLGDKITKYRGSINFTSEVVA